MYHNIWLFIFIYFLTSCEKISIEKEKIKSKQIFCMSKEYISNDSVVFLLQSKKKRFLIKEDLSKVEVLKKENDLSQKGTNIKKKVKGSCLVFDKNIKGTLKLIKKK